MIDKIYKEYFYKEMLKGVSELDNYINGSLTRFIKYEDVLELIEIVLGEGGRGGIVNG